MLFYLREATSEPYGPRGLFSIILLSISFAFSFDLKISDLNHLSLCNNFHRRFNLSSYRQGLDNPLVALGVEICFLVCRGWRRGGARTSFWFDTLVLNWGKYFIACCIILSALRNHNARSTRHQRVPWLWDLCIGVGTRSCLDSLVETLGHSLRFFWLDWVDESEIVWCRSHNQIHGYSWWHWNI